MEGGEAFNGIEVSDRRCLFDLVTPDCLIQSTTKNFHLYYMNHNNFSVHMYRKSVQVVIKRILQ